MDRYQNERCAICGAQATQYAFAEFLCGSEECVDRAMSMRGGPGGHRKNKS